MKKILIITSISIFTFVAKGQVNNGLIAKYSFNNGNANDEVGTVNGTVNGATLTQDRFGNANKAYYFDGIDDYIDFGNNAIFQPSDFSISLWIKYDQLGSTVFSKWYSIGPNYNGYKLRLDNANGKAYGIVGSNMGTGGNVLTDSITNVWHHIVFTYDYLDSISIFLDGLFIESISGITGLYNGGGSPFVIGMENGFWLYYKGVIDDIRFYNRPLNLLEVDSLFNEPNPMTTGINNVYATNNSISIYPNPTKYQINFSEQTNVQLTSVTGQIIVDFKNVNSIDLSNQSTGIYFLAFTDSQGQVIQRSKIVKE